MSLFFPLQEVLTHVQYVFVIVLSLVVFNCIDYDLLFGKKHLEAKTTIPDLFLPMGKCLAGFSLLTWASILVAAVFWVTRAWVTFNHFFEAGNFTSIS